MAVLDAAQRADVTEEVHRALSASLVPVDVPKAAVALVVGEVDDGLEGAEQAILAALGAGAERDWLVAHPGAARRLLELVAGKRREVL